MFNNIGNKLKALAQILCWAGIVASFIAALVLWSNSSYRNPTVGTGFIVLIAGSLGSWIGSWTLYAFGQITEGADGLLEELGFRVTLSCNEQSSTLIAGDPDCLYSLGRFNRDGRLSTAEFMTKLTSSLQ